ncbi:SDR family oxidoreductase [Tunturiibacter gelidoferens]|uniref:Short-subunit dehydrogenase n=1 Tax=Tunturiibacter gelidiferens TaxID=3069689 RepID=A0A9X0QHG8_9BACT|nr:SDR family oxidoreductase [Edaphobacter lichenicola]MBB5330461.1 short-subunit dehydrogenase [Edaphobacter lichenicola]
MKISLKPLSQQTIVITGATNGIGLATAQAAAKRGANLVLAARNEEVLAKTVRELEESGVRALYVVTDVGRREDVERLAQSAIEHFGGFDTWVNNAGQGLWGRLEEVTDEDHRRLFDINFWGVVYGSTTALRHLKKQGGALINLGSVASDFAFPIQGMYSTTKHAIKGFTDALRRELNDEGAPVSVTLIQPAAIGTPFALHAKNYTENEANLPQPIYAPEDVARTILLAAEQPRRALHIGGAGKLMGIFSRLTPGLVDTTSSFMIKSQLKPEPKRHRQDSLWQAGQDGQVRGDQSFIRRSGYTAAIVNPLASLLVVGAVGVGIGFAVWNKLKD